jgi:hypothetical protein
MAQPPNVPQAQSKDQVPRDSRVMQLILQAAGVEDYEPKVVQQLLEFAHRKYRIFRDSIVFVLSVNSLYKLIGSFY